MAEERKPQAPAAPQEKAAEGPSLLDDIVKATRLTPADEGYSLTKKGVETLIAQLVEPGRKIDKVTNTVIDGLIAEIDDKLSRQLDQILHHPDFQKLESGWRALKYLVDKTDLRENIRIEMLNVRKDELLDDFEDAPEIPRSGLYRLVYSSEYGQFGGKP
jgi:type VI secretion system protein ImpC